MICSMTDLILDNVVCYNRLLYICDIGFYPGLDFGLGLDSRGRGQILEAEAEAEAKTLEAEAEAGYFGLEAEARPRGLTSLENDIKKESDYSPTHLQRKLKNVKFSSFRIRI